MSDHVIRLELRGCDVCASNDLASLSAQSAFTRTHTGSVQFDVASASCKGCGFVFVSPVFSDEDLNDYYSNSNIPFTGGDRRKSFHPVPPRGSGKILRQIPGSRSCCRRFPPEKAGDFGQPSWSDARCRKQKIVLAAGPFIFARTHARNSCADRAMDEHAF
ncbi:hypothetical protein HGP13_34515 [Mesorhizobium sp. NZP2077]|uniref:hypothetical protein n=1 Tax=Mesorhizobium sp. NZP2077 TaxID=2483404 RepID=UPI0015521206|nr:hypothetical protein [Mesorhizobium sp. NZP2077]QKD19635.1 hypothetical protein HGP13_34515 [Mesorhizobium sp. NZP2077]